MLFRQAGHLPHRLRRRPRAVPDPRRPLDHRRAAARWRWLRRCCSVRCYLSSYLTPWLVWTVGHAGAEPDPRLGRAVPLRLRGGDGHRRLCDGACHKAGVPWEIAVVLGGLTASDHRRGLRFRRAARQGPVPGAVDAGAAVRDGLGDLARAGDQRRRQATLQAPAMRCWASPSTPTPGFTTWRWAGPAGDAVHAEPAAHRAGPRAGGGARKGLSRRRSSACTASATSWWPLPPRPSSAASAARC